LSLSHLEFVKLQKIFADINADEELLTGLKKPLSEFNPLTYKSTCGDSCLHIAIWRSDLVAVELLLKGGININAEGDNGYTPLDCALNKESGDIVSILIEHGAVPRVCRKKVREWIKNKR